MLLLSDNILYQCLKLIIGKQKYVKKLKNCLLQFLIHMLETEKNNSKLKIKRGFYILVIHI